MNEHNIWKHVFVWQRTLNSTYNEVAFNEKSAITKENLRTKYFPFTFNDVALYEKLPITKENIHIFCFIIGRVECTYNLLGSGRSSDISVEEVGKYR